jgi:hypothetical protein
MCAVIDHGLKQICYFTLYDFTSRIYSETLLQHSCKNLTNEAYYAGICLKSFKIKNVLFCMFLKSKLQ